MASGHPEYVRERSVAMHRTDSMPPTPHPDFARGFAIAALAFRRSPAVEASRIAGTPRPHAHRLPHPLSTPPAKTA